MSDDAGHDRPAASRRPRVLAIAPQPFFSPRGTPFSVYYRTMVTSELGESLDMRIDLLTYGQGQDVDLPNVRIIRTPALRFLGPVKIGPSWQKAIHDVFMLIWTVALLLRHRYTFVHAHEEAVFWCRFLKPLFRFKLVYDMHSSLPQQLTNFKFTTSKWLIGMFRWLEDGALKAANAVITICPDLRDYALSRGVDEARHFLIENSIFDDVKVTDQTRERHSVSTSSPLEERGRVRGEHGAAGTHPTKATLPPPLPGREGGELAADQTRERPSVSTSSPLEGRGRVRGEATSPEMNPDSPPDSPPGPRIAYAGTFEHYQGIDLLIDGFARVAITRPSVQLLLVGGSPPQVEAMKRRADALALDEQCVFTGQVSKAVARQLLATADVLVSPRREGTNTPLKVYEQLASGKPLVATNIYSHTQVLTEDVCFLVDPTADGFAAGLAQALDDTDGAARRVAGAQRLYETAYSRPAYEKKMRDLLALLGIDTRKTEPPTSSPSSTSFTSAPPAPAAAQPPAEAS